MYVSCPAVIYLLSFNRIIRQSKYTSRATSLFAGTRKKERAKGKGLFGVMRFQTFLSTITSQIVSFVLCLSFFLSPPFTPFSPPLHPRIWVLSVVFRGVFFFLTFNTTLRDIYSVRVAQNNLNKQEKQQIQTTWWHFCCTISTWCELLVSRPSNCSRQKRKKKTTQKGEEEDKGRAGQTYPPIGHLRSSFTNLCEGWVERESSLIILSKQVSNE